MDEECESLVPSSHTHTEENIYMFLFSASAPNNDRIATP
jgi:hypothetical protein